jgi:hypothetical protein
MKISIDLLLLLLFMLQWLLPGFVSSWIPPMNDRSNVHEWINDRLSCSNILPHDDRIVSRHNHRTKKQCCTMFVSSQRIDSNDNDRTEEETIETIKFSDKDTLDCGNKIMMIDHDNDMKLNRRFQYKVNALMGTFVSFCCLLFFLFLFI